MGEKKQIEENNSENGTSRRDFLKFCSAVGLAIGLGPTAGSKVAAALTSANRPPVLWLHFSECTACTESLLRSRSPFVDDLILETISIDYHETLMAGAGETVHKILTDSADKYKGQFICVVEGAIPTKDNGIYGTINGRTMLSIAEEICPKAKCIIAIGNCASFGGIAAAAPNPTGAKNVIAALKTIDLPQVINVPGCPPNPVSFVGVIANYLLVGALPETDDYLRPKFAYDNTVHDECPFQHDTVRCLKSTGCKGPNTFNNCTTVKYNNGTNFPMAAGHVCIGCSEPFFWDTNPDFWHKLAQDVETFPTPFEVFEKQVSPVSVKPSISKRLSNRMNVPQNQTFDILGRKIKSKLSGSSQTHQTAKAKGLFIEKSNLGVNKHIDLK
jgi:[NiFe] hydrogenase small subunit